MDCRIIGAPVDAGTQHKGCAGGPRALRDAGLAAALVELGHGVADLGDVAPPAAAPIVHPNAAIRALGEVAAWTSALGPAAAQVDGFPIFLGGDHSISAGVMAGLARRAEQSGRRLFVVWLDAHPDFHTLDTTRSGNLHGVPLAYATGQPGFEGYLPRLDVAVAPERVCALGLRHVEADENAALAKAGVLAFDMTDVDRRGIPALLEPFLERVRRGNGLLHVSLDADVLDPSIAPGVGTPVPGGMTFREAHLTMELLCESGLPSSLDIVELNPLLDRDGITGRLLVDLAASLMGRRILSPAARSA
jgi:arginase